MVNPSPYHVPLTDIASFDTRTQPCARPIVQLMRAPCSEQSQAWDCNPVLTRVDYQVIGDDGSPKWQQVIWSINPSYCESKKLRIHPVGAEY